MFHISKNLGIATFSKIFPVFKKDIVRSYSEDLSSQKKNKNKKTLIFRKR